MHRVAATCHQAPKRRGAIPSRHGSRRPAVVHRTRCRGGSHSADGSHHRTHRRRGDPAHRRVRTQRPSRCPSPHGLADRGQAVVDADEHHAHGRRGRVLPDRSDGDGSAGGLPGHPQRQHGRPARTQGPGERRRPVLVADPVCAGSAARVGHRDLGGSARARRHRDGGSRRSGAGGRPHRDECLSGGGRERIDR